MMWMGKVSAWGAVAIGVICLASAAYEATAWPVAFMSLIVAALLFLSAYRTLRKMSGGLRLLCGAWGVVAGSQIWVLNSLAWRLGALVDSNIIADDVSLPFHEIRSIVFFVALAGLALTVLHKESK